MTKNIWGSAPSPLTGRKYIRTDIFSGDEGLYDMMLSYQDETKTKGK